jgi:rare lipoprotein A
MLSRFGLALPIMTALLLLAGCTATRHPPPLVAGEQPVPPGGGKGVYKIGSPYQVDGVWYYPAEDFNYDETGIASWYGEAFHGKYTANGEVFDLNAVTAAHKTLPMPSIVEVTNLENGRRIQVRVNDRGPFIRGRVIDLSRRSAQLLGFEPQGTAKVRVRILVPESIQVAALAGRNGGEDGPAIAAAAPKAAPVGAVVATALPPPPGARAAPPPPTQALPRPVPAPSPPPVQLASLTPPPNQPVTVVPTRPTQIYIQAGAFAKADNARKVKDRIDALGAVKISGARVQGVDVYRVRLGPIASVDEADQLLDRVVKAGVQEARIVVD